MNTEMNPLPPSCARTRDAFGLQLVDGSSPGADAESHVKICAACALVVGRMKETWDAAGDVLPRMKSSPNLDAILDRVIATRGETAPATVLPFRPVERDARRKVRRSNVVSFAIGVALAASLAAFMFVIPSLFEEPAPEIARAPGPPKVVLASAMGDVSFVPADGSVFRTPAKGDALPPGLFAATGGAALSIEGQGLLAVRGDAQVWIGGVERAPELSIARGEIFVDLPKGTIQTFVVRTPNGAVHVTGTQFTVNVKKDGTKVDVTRGSVKVVGASGEIAVLAGQSAAVAAGAPPSVADLVTSPSEDPLAWVRDLAPDRVPAAVVAMVTPKRASAEATPDDVSKLLVAGLPEIVVQHAMEKREAAMRYCYEQQLMLEPELRVRAAIRFTVDEKGETKDLRVDGVSNDKLRACLTEAARAARFPPTAPGTEVRISYPVKLVPASELDDAP